MSSETFLQNFSGTSNTNSKQTTDIQISVQSNLSCVYHLSGAVRLLGRCTTQWQPHCARVVSCVGRVHLSPIYLLCLSLKPLPHSFLPLHRAIIGSGYEISQQHVIAANACRSTTLLFSSMPVVVPLMQ